MAHAKNKSIKTSSDNFVSLQWMRSGGFAGVFESYTIQNHELIQNPNQFPMGIGGKSGRDEPQPLPQVAPLSDNQWKELINELKKADIPAIAGNYKQEGLSDGFNETLMLTLSGTDNLDQTFTVSNYGNKAPSSYTKFAAYLSTLLNRKFNPAPASTSVTTPKQ